MAERSIVARLRAEISDYRNKMREAATLTDKVGQAAEQSSKRAGTSFGAMAKHVQANEQSISKLSNVALGVGGGMALAVGGVVKTFAEFDKQMSGVAATGDDAKANIDELREAAIRLGSATSFSATEAAAGVENLMKAGVSAADVMGGGLQGSLDLAAAGSMAVGDAAETAATALTQFKLSGKDVPHVADLLAAGAGKAQGEVSDMGQALNQSGLVASQFGLSIEETTGTLAAFASAGLVGSDAGTSFKTMLLKLANPAKDTQKAMDSLGIAAYDANGQFVGITNLAGQLQDKLGGLTQAQRDAAMAQIFGSDAVRAANVLYQQGAEGITQWESKVNDAGYASETASTKMDNLAGDFEKLKGGIESAFLNSGSGANDALRGLTQRVGGFVDLIGKVPAPVAEAGLGIAAVGSAGLLAVGGVGKIATSVADASEAFSNLAEKSPRTASGIGKVGKAAGLAALAVAGLAAAGSIQNSLTDGAIIQGSAEIERALLHLSATADAHSLDDFFLKSKGDAIGGSHEVVAGVTDIDSALTRMFDKRWDTKLVDFGASLFSWTGASSEMDRLSESFKGMDSGLSGMLSNGKPDEAAAAFREIAEAAERQGIPLANLVDLMPQYKDQLVAQANQLGVTNLSAEQYADWMGGKIPGAIRAAQVSADAHAGKLGEQGDAMLTAKEAASQLTTAESDLATQNGKLNTEVEKVVNSFTILSKGGADAEEATSNWEAALDGLAASAKESGHSLDIATDAGRSNRKSITGAIEALDAKVSADFKANSQTKGLAKATDIASEALRKGRKRILDSADAAGYSRGEVKKMQDRMLLTPDELRTQVNTPGIKEAQDAIKKLEKRIKDLEGKSINITANFSAKADKAVASLNKNIVSKYGNTGRKIALARGGPVWGAGTETSDSIDAKLSTGEFVIKARSVNKIGRDRLHHMNERGEVPKFANGGLVERDLIANTLGRNTFAPASEPFKGQSQMLEDAASTWMKGLTKSYLAALNEAAGSYGAASPGKYGGSVFGADQLRNAATIATVGAGMGKKAIQIALMTAMQESGLRNLSFGDRDSLGLFQQRAPWGSASQRRDPRTAAGMFFHGGMGGQRGLDDIPGWRGMSLARAAQAVQVSAFPGAYARWADEAEDIMAAMSQFGGGGPAGSGSSKRVRWRGGTFTERFRNTLMNAEKLAGTPIHVMQGGFSTRVAASGASHKGDAVDAQWDPRVLSGLRRAHVAAWHRTPAQGFVHHIHGIPLPGYGYPGGSGTWQAQDYLRGGNGLAYGGEVFGPGTGTSDSVWKRLSKGEWVVPAQQAQRLKPLLQDINKGRVTLRAPSAVAGAASAAPRLEVVKAGDVVMNSPQFGSDERKVVAAIQARQADSLAMAGLTVAP